MKLVEYKPKQQVEFPIDGREFIRVNNLGIMCLHKYCRVNKCIHTYLRGNFFIRDEGEFCTDGNSPPPYYVVEDNNLVKYTLPKVEKYPTDGTMFWACRGDRLYILGPFCANIRGEIHSPYNGIKRKLPRGKLTFFVMEEDNG